MCVCVCVCVCVCTHMYNTHRVCEYIPVGTCMVMCVRYYSE